MPTAGIDWRRDAIRRTLAHRCAGAADANAVVEAALDTWRQMSTRLEPVIGARGVAVLFGRSVHLTGKSFRWLAIDDRGDSAALFESFRQCFEIRDVAVAAQASCALLITVTELLATLIGESLTERLLGAVWLSPRSESEPQTAR